MYLTLYFYLIHVIVVKKDIDDNKLKSIINKIKDFNLIYDNELNSKIKELYG